MRVDRTYDRAAAAQQRQLPSEDVPPESYRPAPPADRWEVALDGPKVVLEGVGGHPTPAAHLEGREVASSRPGERRFDLDGWFGGGRLVLRGDDAELTLFGSGVPIVSSERGKLVAK